MHMDILPTAFAPAGRSSAEDIQAQSDALRTSAVAQTLEALSVIVVVLNTNRQIVFANAKALAVTGQTMRQILGKRPGEAFSCVHAFDSVGGCGTTEFCSRCGAVKAILKGLQGRIDIQEYNLLRHDQEALGAMDFQVNASPIQVAGWDFLIFSIQDISHEKRRRNLERLFFHDVLNTAGGLRGLMDMLRQELPDPQKPDADFIHDGLAYLVEEIIAQKDLLAAENNELTPAFTALYSTQVLKGATALAQGLAAEGNVTLAVDPQSADVAFVSDAVLVRRILGNMLKNALEAVRPGQRVDMGCREERGGVAFWVKNPGVMSDDARLRVFTRSFSTKGAGRGLGTYGMKLLAERYLGGMVWFDTNPEQGTVFHVWLPARSTTDRAGHAH